MAESIQPRMAASNCPLDVIMGVGYPAHQRMIFKSKATWIMLGFLVVILALWLFWPPLAKSFLTRWQPGWESDTQTSPLLPGLGQFGDMFGALTSLFTILAFFGVAVTAWLQYRTLKHQQAEIEKQQRTNTASLQLSALTAILNSLQDELSTETNETEKHFLKSEVARTKGELREMLKTWPQEDMRLSSQFLDDGPITADDLVKEICSRFPYIPENSIRSEQVALVNRLLAARINSVNRFKQMMSDKDAIAKTVLLYIEELKRPPYRILDPAAVATWPPMLHLRKDGQTFEQLRLTLRNCPEANQNQQLFRELPLVSLDAGRRHVKVTQPSIAVVNDQDVKPFPHFNAMRTWLSESKTERVKIFVFDCDPGVRNWVQVDPQGNKV